MKELIYKVGLIFVLVGVSYSFVYGDRINDAVNKLKDRKNRQEGIKEIEAFGTKALGRLKKIVQDENIDKDTKMITLILLGKVGKKKETAKKVDKRSDVIMTAPAKTEEDAGVNDLLSDMLKNNRDSHIREASAIGLGHLSDTRTVARLKEALNDESVNVRMRVAWALGKMGDSSGKDLALKTIKEKDVTGKLLAVEALEAIGDKNVIPELKKNLNSKNNWTRIYSKMAIKKLEILGLQGEARLDFLKNTLNDKQFEVNQWAAQELGKEILNNTVNRMDALNILIETTKNSEIAGNYTASKILIKLKKLGKISENEIK